MDIAVPELAVTIEYLNCLYSREREKVFSFFQALLFDDLPIKMLTVDQYTNLSSTVKFSRGKRTTFDDFLI